MKRLIMLGEDHGYFIPAHDRAMNKHVREGINTKFPTKSSWDSFVRQFKFMATLSLFWGIDRKSAIMASVIPPTGRVM
jgi:hypothetical protein